MFKFHLLRVSILALETFLPIKARLEVRPSSESISLYALSLCRRKLLRRFFTADETPGLSRNSGTERPFRQLFCGKSFIIQLKWFKVGGFV